MIRSTLLTSAAAVLVASAASAAPVTIDNFSTTNFQVVGAPTLNTNMNPATTSGATTDAIGGTRTITNTRTAPAGNANPFGQQVQSVVTAGRASVSLGALTEGFSVFSWDAGGADLVDGTNSRIEINVIDADQSGVTYTLNFGGVSVSKVASTSGGILTYNFSEFAGVDFTNISAISLTIAGPVAFDTNFDLLQAVGTVPLPAAGFLTLGGLAALGAARSRRKAK